MAIDRRFIRPPLAVRRSAMPHRRPPGTVRGSRLNFESIDWTTWLQSIARKRRELLRLGGGTMPHAPPEYFVDATCASFRLDGIAVSNPEVITALSRTAAKRRFRSRTIQRIRNHVAVLYTIENRLRHGLPLKSRAVLRWYTSISSGLSTSGIGDQPMARLEQVVRRVNSPQLRLQSAIQEVAQTYLELLSDPLFPSFNGILSRLLLRYHLGRCVLPFAVLTGAAGVSEARTEAAITLDLLRAIDHSLGSMLR